MTGAAVVDAIFERFRSSGGALHLGEPVTLSEHMLQTATAAELDGGSPALVAAALLHDYGHLIHELPEDSVTGPPTRSHRLRDRPKTITKSSPWRIRPRARVRSHERAAAAP